MKNWIERPQMKLVAGLVGCFGSVVILALWGPTQTAAAATIPVTTINDEYGTGAETCSLREAITAANTDAAFGGCVAGSGSDVVSVPAGVYVLTRAGANEDNNATGDLDIRSTLVVSGAGQSLTIVDANQLDRVLHVLMADVDLNVVGLTVQHGLASDSSGGGAYVPEGGAVITGSEFVSNTASLDGGGVFIGRDITTTNATFISNTTTMSVGGGIFVNGQAVLISSNFLSNTSPPTTSIGFQGRYYHAGGLYAVGQVVISDSLFGFNQGGGVFTNRGGVITNSSFISNFTDGLGGGIFVNAFENTSLSPAKLAIYNSLFRSNTSESTGGGISVWGANVMLVGSTFTNNIAQNYGGGLDIWVGDLSVSNSLFQSNQAEAIDGGAGGGIHWIGGGAFTPGLGSITNTLFISNTAGGNGSFVGGGAISAGGNLIIVNSLFAGNTAFGGPGASLYGMGTLSLIHVTIAGPQVISGTAVDFANASIRNTIIASHTVGINGSATEDYNLFYGNDLDRMDVMTGLNSLNGDPAFVNPAAGDYHLRSQSAAIRKGLDLGLTPDFDGNPRLPGIAPDIGYVEFPEVLVAGLTLTNTSPHLQDMPVQFTASITAGSGVSYTWLFDDGFSGTGITTTHAYEVPGHYTVTVLATDQYGWTILARTPVTITEPQHPNLAGTLNAEFVGSLVTYTLAVSNPNPVITATNVVVSGSVPPNTELVSTNGISVSSGGYYGLGYVSLPTTTLTPTAQITLTWTVAVPELKGSIITHAGAASDTAVIDRRVLVRVVFHTYLPVLSRE